jgi:hypothetical protein
MKIRYTEHALYRLHKREITKQDVEDALRHGMSEPTHGGAMIAKRYRNNKQPLVVIYYIKGFGKILVVTVYEE